MRNCQIDEGMVSHFDRLSQSRSEAQVGLLVGRVGLGNRDFVAILIPSPPFEGGSEAVRVQGVQSHAPAKKAGQKAKSSGLPGVQIQINDEWVAEHATQVAPLVPGGLAVVGLYLFCPDAAFAAGNAQLCRALASLRDSCFETGCTEEKDLLLLNVCSATRKMTLKELPANAANSPGLRACECKPAPVLGNLAATSTRYHIHSACTVTGVDKEARLQFEAVLARERQAIAEAIPCSTTGGPFEDDAILADIPSTDGCAVAVELLTPPDCLSIADERSGDTAYGQARICGVIEGRAFVHKRDSFKTAVASLKADLQRSLRARMAALLTDAEDAAESGDGKPELLQSGADFYQSAFRLPMPRRALLLVKAPISFSDYPLEEEADAAVMSTAQDLLALKWADASQVDWPEETAAMQEALGMWQPLRKDAIVVGKAVGQEDASSSVECHHLVIGAIIVGCLAIAAGLGYIVM